MKKLLIIILLILALPVGVAGAALVSSGSCSNTISTGEHVITLVTNAEAFVEIGSLGLPYIPVPLDYGGTKNYEYTGKSGTDSYWTGVLVDGDRQDSIVMPPDITVPSGSSMQTTTGEDFATGLSNVDLTGNKIEVPKTANSPWEVKPSGGDATTIIAIAQAGSPRAKWDANSETDLAGYKLYCGAASRAYGTPVDVGLVTEYVLDLSGWDDGVYYLAVTAYDNSGNESGYSNEVTHNVDHTADHLVNGDYIVAQSTAESYVATVASVTYRILNITNFNCNNLAITIYGTNRISGSLTNSGSATLAPYNPPRVTN